MSPDVLSGRPPLPCREDPERWFDPDQRVAALRGCLACPVRTWCARQAVKERASWGMWAGIWIDGIHQKVRPYLLSVATSPPLQATTGHTRPVVTSAGKACTRQPRLSARALVQARSSDHCEVMLDGCRYSGDRICSRFAQAPTSHPASAAELFVCCNSCGVRLDTPGRIAVVELGYRFGSSDDVAAATPFFWRQSKWLLLSLDGRLQPLCSDALGRASVELSPTKPGLPR